MPSVLQHCWLGVRKSIRPVKIEWWGVGVVVCLECRLFAYGPADATAIPKRYHLLPHLNPDWFYLSGIGFPRLFWKRGHWMGVVVISFCPMRQRNDAWDTLAAHHMQCCWWRPSVCSCCCNLPASIRLETTSRKTQPHVARSHWIRSETTQHRSFLRVEEDIAQF